MSITETQSKHTPGPWGFDGHGINTKGARLATMGKRTQIHDGKEWREIPQDERDANAMLMAAAPDLLKCLERAVDRVEVANREGNPILSGWLAHAQAAIAKATA